MTDIRELLKRARAQLVPSEWPVDWGIGPLCEEIDAALAQPPTTGPLSDVHRTAAGDAAPEELPASPVPTVDGPGLLRSAIAFLGTTLRTDSRDLTDWRSDVAIAVGLLERALDAPQEPAAGGFRSAA